MKEYYLQCIYDSRNSFYKKAKVLKQTMSDWEEIVLYSYGTIVAKIIKTKNTKKYIYYGKYSQTTTRHQKEFFKQNGLDYTQLPELFEKGQLTIKEG